MPDTRYQIDIAPTIGELPDFTPVHAVGTRLFDAPRFLPPSDFTGDLKSDIQWRGTGGDLWLWPMHGAAQAGEAFVRTVSDPNWQIRSVGDQDGDGRADLLWQHATQGDLWAWLMNGGARVSEPYVGTVSDTNYRIVASGDASGITQSLIPAGRITQGLVASSGYLGASAVGCLLMAAARRDRWTRTILWATGTFMLVTLVIWMRNLFDGVVVLAWAGALVALARKGSGHASRFVLSLLAIQVALDSVYDIRVLFVLDGGYSDAETMAELFLLPS